MYQLERCNKIENHNPHDFTVAVVATCSGITQCGKEIHEPHAYDDYETRRCPGRCHCGLDSRNPMHGPADHK